MMTALTPLAFPAIVTPYEIAALVVFLALSPDVRSRLLVGAVHACDHGAEPLLHAHDAAHTAGPDCTDADPRCRVGHRPGSLGLQIINNSLRALGVNLSEVCIVIWRVSSATAI